MNNVHSGGNRFGGYRLFGRLLSVSRGNVGVKETKIRHPLARFITAAFVIGVALGLGQANATSFLALTDLASQSSRVETIGYYGYPCVGSCRYYRYWYPWYYKPYYYGYRYKPYYGHYGYRHYRPYRRRFWYW